MGTQGIMPSHFCPAVNFEGSATAQKRIFFHWRQKDRAEQKRRFPLLPKTEGETIKIF